MSTDAAGCFSAPGVILSLLSFFLFYTLPFRFRSVPRKTFPHSLSIMSRLMLEYRANLVALIYNDKSLSLMSISFT